MKKSGLATLTFLNIGSKAIFQFNEPDFVVSQRRVRRVDDDDELDVGVGDVAENLNERNKQKNLWFGDSSF